jgi:hypothetical protein
MPEFKLLLDDDEVENLKIVAARRKVRPQTIARDAFRAGMASPVLPAHVGTPEAAVASPIPSQLHELRSLLERAMQVLNEVLTDGEDPADTLGEIETKVARLVADSGDPGGDSGLPPPSRVTKPKGRRAR